MPVVFWFAFFFIIVGIGLSIYSAVKALNSAFSKDEEHVLFWIGTFLTVTGAIMLMYLVVTYSSKINKLNNETIKLYRMISECKNGNSNTMNPSSPGMWSRFKGFFNRSVPAAGNPGEVNPFKVQEQSS